MKPGRRLAFTCVFMVAAWGAGAVPAHANTIRIVIENLVYSPAEISATVGDQIQWINKDALVHTATAKGRWDVQIAPGKTGSVVLKTAGAADYYCRFHPNMKGRIVVAPK